MHSIKHWNECFIHLLLLVCFSSYLHSLFFPISMRVQGINSNKLYSCKCWTFNKNNFVSCFCCCKMYIVGMHFVLATRSHHIAVKSEFIQFATGRINTYDTSIIIYTQLNTRTVQWHIPSSSIGFDDFKWFWRDFFFSAVCSSRCYFIVNRLTTTQKCACVCEWPV